MQLLLMVICLSALIVALLGLFVLWIHGPSTSLQEAADSMSESVKTEVYGPDGIATSLAPSPMRSYRENSSGTSHTTRS